MNELEREIRREIAARGPLQFDGFMELALYHPALGYYRRPRDPFGIYGDYFTNAQLQPVFGRLISRQIAEWKKQLGSPAEFTVVELGAGRGEIAREIGAIAVERDSGAMPELFTGVVFSNEFFDALPVRVARFDGSCWRERLVGFDGDKLVWVEGDLCQGELKEYLRRFVPAPEPGQVAEANLHARAWIERIARSLKRGFVLTIDYGYTATERRRFPQGTLMSYRRHAASTDVLADPGERDITAHVPFSALAEWGRELGLHSRPLMTQAQFLLSIGEADQFRSVLATDADRMQLKTLLFGMGETFRVLVQQRNVDRGT